MSITSDYPGVNRLLPIFAGAVLISAAFLVDAGTEGEGMPQLGQIGFVTFGCAFAVLGIASNRHRFGGSLAKASLVILSTTLLITICEVTFRVVGFDFERLNQPGDDIPIYYRTATVHAGEGVFRRPGPASWRGQVRRAYMRMQGTNDGPYAEEEPIVARYDALGFRNPEDLRDWDVVVTGDSFVELGFLPYEDLFTSIAARKLGLRVKNLGVSGTGPISQTFYVKNYGKAASTKDAVLCFFEGNDLEDLSRELRNTESFRTTGQPWEHRKQMSFLKTLFEKCHQLRQRGGTEVRGMGIKPNAALTTTHPERPMTVYGMAPAWERLGQRREETVVRALASWASMVRSNSMRPWVAYLPDSHRVFHGLIHFTDTNSAVANWKPGDFGAHLGAACTNLDIGFIDTFPALRREAEAGRVPYNLIGDTHFSLDGSRIVADVLADHLKSGHIH